MSELQLPQSNGRGLQHTSPQLSLIRAVHISPANVICAFSSVEKEFCSWEVLFLFKGMNPFMEILNTR